MDEKTLHLIDSYLPMSEQSFLLLLGLVEPRHGYGIMQMVSEQTKGRVNLSPSTVYTLLYKMETDGLIQTVSEVDRRKVYCVTSVGRTVLNAEAKRLSALASFASEILFSDSCKSDEKATAAV